MNTMFAAMLGGWEIVLILAVVLILFGAKKVPELARGLGQGIKEFKRATREVTDEINNASNDTPAPQHQKTPSNSGHTLPQKTVSHSSDTPKA